MRSEQLLYRRIEPSDSDGFAEALEYFANQATTPTGLLNATSDQRLARSDRI
jgi:hypothetical protein